jgi:hypothetical protein
MRFLFCAHWDTGVEEALACWLLENARVTKLGADSDPTRPHVVRTSTCSMNHSNEQTCNHRTQTVLFCAHLVPCAQ